MENHGQPDLNAFRSFVIQQYPNITASQLKSLDNFIASKQTEELARQGVIDLGDLAKSDPGAAVRLYNEGIRPGTAQTADEKKLQAKKEGLGKSLDLLEKNLKEAGPIGRGFIGGPLGAALSGATGGLIAPESLDFEALRRSMIGPVARIISQEAGVLTDYDIKRAEELLPKLRDDAATAQRKLDNIRLLLGEQSNGKESQNAVGRFKIINVQ